MKAAQQRGRGLPGGQCCERVECYHIGPKTSPGHFLQQIAAVGPRCQGHESAEGLLVRLRRVRKAQAPRVARRAVDGHAVGSEATAGHLVKQSQGFWPRTAVHGGGHPAEAPT